MEKNYKYLYGPVYSWRLGVSLGIDPISTKSKTCNFDCIYCQLGKTVQWENERKVFVKTQDFIKEIKTLPASLTIDHFTFSGRGEPTLAKNLGEMIDALRKVRKEKIAVITNSSLMYNHSVRSDLLKADFVLAKLDACSRETFESVNKTMEGANFPVIVDGIKDFRSLFRGKLALQIMFMKENKSYAHQIARVVYDIDPDEVELNTPLRPSAVKPLSKKELHELKSYFQGLPVVSVYDVERKSIEPLNEEETMKRHGNFKKTIAGALE